MKKSIIKTFLLGLFVIFALTIALPTFILNINGQNFKIRGWDPIDYNPNFLLSEFKFLPSLDLYGGSISTIKVDMTDVAEDQKLTVLENTKNLLYRRLLKTNPGYFEINSMVNKEKNEYNLILKLSEKISQDYLSILISPADISFWVEDTETSASVTEEEAQNNPLAGRKPSALTNEDIESVSVISDSTCYVNDPNAPRNYCLKIIFKEASKNEFVAALYQSSSGQYPMLMVLDGYPIAIQSMGQFYSGVTPDRELVIYPGIIDTWLANSVLGAIMSDQPIDKTLSVVNTNTVEASLGANAMINIKIASTLSLVAVIGLLAFYFRRRSPIAILSILIYGVTVVAMMKVFNLILDLSTIMGAVAGFTLFLSFVVYLLYRIRTASKSGLVASEIETEFVFIKNAYRNLTIAFIITTFIVSLFSPIFIINFYNSLGFGVILGYFIFANFVKLLLPIFFLPKEKWQTF